MLDKLKQLGQLKAMQEAIKSERFEYERDGIKVVVNGNLMVEQVILTQDLPKETGGQLIKDCVNEAIKKAQWAVAQKFSGLNLGL